MKKIHLAGTHNTRDLGGTPTSNGVVKYKKLIRSGELSRITAEDAQILTSIPVKRVIDLRTDLEKKLSPDIKMESVEYVHNPIIESTTFGITYEKSDGETIVDMLIKGFAKLADRNETPSEHMVLLYKKFVTTPFSVEHYRSFFELLSEPSEGATLWHCSAGKDRVGTCTALLLTALGANRDTIIKDYLYTNESGAGNTKNILGKIRPFVNDTLYDIVKKNLEVEQVYLDTFFLEIEENFGSTDKFLRNELKLTEKKIERLRLLYLDK